VNFHRGAVVHRRGGSLGNGVFEFHHSWLVRESRLHVL
jgi:hypothetical protein